MRSVALAFVSTLLLSPISAFTIYGDDHAFSKANKGIKVSDLSTTKVARIAVTVDYFKSEVDYFCNREKDTCLEQHKCYIKDEIDEIDELCGRINKCYEKKKKCHKNFKCSKKTKICHKKTTNRHGFLCDKDFYYQDTVLAAAKAACKKIGNNPKSGNFPYPHTTFKFKRPGPYVEWPVTRNEQFNNIRKKSKRRIVMTMDCGVVGAVIRHKGGDYTKCKFQTLG